MAHSADNDLCDDLRGGFARFQCRRCGFETLLPDYKINAQLYSFSSQVQTNHMSLHALGMPFRSDDFRNHSWIHI